MGFIESYIMIFVFAMLANPIAKKYKLHHKGILAWYSIVIIGGFWVIDTLIYLGAFDWVWNLINTHFSWISIECGRDFLWNAFIYLGIDMNIPYTVSGLALIAFLLILLYLPWYVFIKEVSLLLFGGKSYQKGIIWLLKPAKNNPQDVNHESKFAPNRSNL